MSAAHAARIAATLAWLDADLRSALDGELHFLTAREREIFDALLYDGGWVNKARLCRQLWRFSGPAERHALQVNLSRIRRKLQAHAKPWRLDSTFTHICLHIGDEAVA